MSKARVPTNENNTHLFQTFLNNSITVFFAWKAVDGWPVEYVSKNVSQFGYTSEDFLSAHIKYKDFIHKDDLQRVIKEVIEHTQNKQDKFSQKYRIITADKKIRWIDDHTIIERDSDGNAKKYLGIISDITDKIEMQSALHQSEDMFRNITENAKIGIFIYKEKIIYANQELSNQSGYSIEELYNMHIWDFAHESSREMVKDIVLRRCQGELLDKKCHDFKFIAKNGKIKTVRTMVNTMKYNGEYVGVGTIIDISDVLQTKKELTLLSKAIEQTDDMVRITDKNGKIIFVNDSNLEHSGYDREDLIGKTPRIFKSGKHTDEFYKNLWSTLLSGNTYKGVLINKKKDGSIYYEQETITPICDDKKSIQNFVVTAKDITKRIEMEKELYKRATIDSLTGIYNRQKGNEQLDIELDRFKRYSNNFVLIMLDIDYFKEVNDVYGHDVGDDILKEICTLISSYIRKSDTLSRWGGEEFIIIAPDLTEEKALQFAEKIRQKISSNNFSEVAQITASFGITFPKADESKERLLKRVDDALYMSKENGRNQVNIL